MTPALRDPSATGHPERGGAGATEPGNPVAASEPENPAPAAGSAASERGNPSAAAGAATSEPTAEHAALGTLKNPLPIKDPRAMRALAHSARIAILQHLAIEGPATATECAEVAGLSPSACSYHLRALASYGFVEEDLASAADGRHRPWRARIISMYVGDEPGQPVAVEAAGRLLKESMQARIEEVREQYADREAEYPPQWRAAVGNGMDVLHVTPEELDSLRRRLHDLLDDYRRLERADRPPGAKRVHVLLEFLPWFDPGEDR